MKIRLTYVLINDQDKALDFYTEVLGFIKKKDFPVGKFKWLTVISPEEPDGPELLLEPSNNPAAQEFKNALFEQGIAAASFAVDDIYKEYKRLKELGVQFTVKPTKVEGEASYALFDDTCGNLIQIYQV